MRRGTATNVTSGQSEPLGSLRCSAGGAAGARSGAGVPPTPSVRRSSHGTMNASAATAMSTTAAWPTSSPGLVLLLNTNVTRSRNASSTTPMRRGTATNATSGQTETLGSVSCSAGVVAGARPVAAMTASRIAANHSAASALKPEGKPSHPSIGETKTWRRCPPSS